MSYLKRFSRKKQGKKTSLKEQVISLQFLSYCSGSNTTLDVGSFSGYLWSTGGSSQTVDVTTIDNPVYVIVTDENACTGTDILNVIENANPIPNFDYSTNGLELSFSNSSQDAESYFWDFGDSETSILENPVHQYAVSDIYQISLTATNTLCGDSTLSSEVDFTVSIEDLENNLGLEMYPNPSTGKFALKISNPEQKDFHIEIYSISGKKVFSKEYKDQKNIDFIDLSTQANGLFLVKYISDKKTVTKKLIINK